MPDVTDLPAGAVASGIPRGVPAHHEHSAQRRSS
jgi:hypothetical protein